MSQVNSISNHNVDFRTLSKQLFDAFTISQFYEALNQAGISLDAGFIDDNEFNVICETASILDPILYDRWERNDE